MLPDDFSKVIEQVYKDALAKADQIVADAAMIRNQAIGELDAAKELRNKAALEADGLAEQYFENRQTQFQEAARIELLRNLTRKHLENGKSAAEIAEWLEVPFSFIQQIEAILNRLENAAEQRRQLNGNPEIHYTNKGRGGTVHYVNGQVGFDLWWEFAGGDAVVIIDIPTEKDWEKRTGLKMDERAATIRFIGDQIIKDQLSGKGNYIVGENTMTFYSGS